MMTLAKGMAHHFQLLGTLAVESEAHPAKIMKSPKGLAVLAYLIVTNQVQPREVVADLLWEATSTAQALGSLRTLLSRTRKWVPELQMTRQNIAFRPQPDTVVDLMVVRQALGSDDLEELDQALRLYQGDLLGTFRLADAPRFNEWLLLEQEYLRQRVLDAHHHLVAHYEETGQWQAGISLAQHWLQIDPLDELAQTQLMTLLAANGQTEAALAHYALYCDRLWQTLAVEPQAAISHLAQTLEQELSRETAVGLPLIWRVYLSQGRCQRTLICLIVATMISVGV